MLQPRNCPQDCRLNINRQTCRDPVRIVFVAGQPFRLDKNLVPWFVRKANDFVLDRGTVARTDRFDHTAVHGGTIEVLSDEGVGLFIGVSEMTGHLRCGNFLCSIRKRSGRIITWLRDHDLKIDRVPI